MRTREVSGSSGDWEGLGGEGESVHLAVVQDGHGHWAPSFRDVRLTLVRNFFAVVVLVTLGEACR